MKFLNSIFSLTEVKDMSELPESSMKDIQKNIRKGAQDKAQKWSNALELVHKAYEITGIERPDPSFRSAWKQYEENIAFSVQALAKERGLDDDWRMSSAIFHESTEHYKNFRVEVTGPNLDDTNFIVAAANRNEVVKSIKKAFKDEYTVKADMDKQGGAIVTFWHTNIRTNNRISIKPARYGEEIEK